MVNKDIIIISICITVIGIVALYSFSSFQKSSNRKIPEERALITTKEILSEKVGTSHSSSEETKNFTSSVYGFTISYPSTWIVGDTRLGSQGGGTFQLFNYDPSKVVPHDIFSGNDNMNKIEMVIIDGHLMEDPDHLLEKTEEIILSGNKMQRYTYDDRIYYEIAIPNHPEKFLRAGIYGDEGNFKILENIMSSLQWVP